MFCSFCEALLIGEFDSGLCTSITKSLEATPIRRGRNALPIKIYEATYTIDAAACIRNKNSCWLCCRMYCQLGNQATYTHGPKHESREQTSQELMVSLNRGAELIVSLKLKDALLPFAEFDIEDLSSNRELPFPAEGMEAACLTRIHEKLVLDDESYGSTTKGLLDRTETSLTGSDAAHGSFKIIQSTLSSSTQLRFDYVRVWFEKCCNTHQACGPRHKSFDSLGGLPKRLLSIPRTTTKICLMVTDGLIAQDVRYATLSYMWGQPTFKRLLSSCYDELVVGIEVSTLAKTFQESIALCQSLDIPYIWIDSLCIIQDSVKDWEMESAGMHKVYSNSLLNIVASASDNPTQGLYRPILSLVKTLVKIKISSRIALCETRFADGTLGENLRLVHNRQPVFRRSWILQECVLAPRVLYWDDTQITLRCISSVEAEIGAVVPTQRVGVHARYYPENRKFIHENILNQRTADGLDTLWQSIAEDFSNTHTTKYKDRIFALSGLAAFMHVLYQRLGTKTQYISGVWEHDLLSGIAWYSMRMADTTELKMMTESTVPSWSWINRANITWTRGMVWPNFWRGGNMPHRMDLQLTAVNAVHADPKKPYGDYVSVSLTFRATVFNIHCGDFVLFKHETGGPQNSSPLEDSKLRFLTLNNPVNYQAMHCSLDEPLNGFSGREVLCMLLDLGNRDKPNCDGFGLIIVHVGDDVLGRKQYKRVGAMHILMSFGDCNKGYDCWKMQKDDLVEREITLI